MPKKTRAKTKTKPLSVATSTSAVIKTARSKKAKIIPFKKTGDRIIGEGTPADPFDIDHRLQRQAHELLIQMEGSDGYEVTLRERIAALIAIGRIRDREIKRAANDDSERGTTVRKYAEAFSANAAGGGADRERDDADALDDGKHGRRRKGNVPTDWFETVERELDDADESDSAGDAA
jgi:hypothetical protein